MRQSACFGQFIQCGSHICLQRTQSLLCIALCSCYRDDHPDWIPDLSGEHLGCRDLASFNFEGADLRGSDLSQAKLSAGFRKARIGGAVFDNNTKFPAGLNPVSWGALFHVSGQRVFLVHGHHGEMRESTARFLEKLGLDVVVLHEQPNRGQTIIEKLMDCAIAAGVAVVLLTADDRGGRADQSYAKQQQRARQNVILELGFFLGKLGRKRVIALHESSVEIPSDFQGVLYIRIDPSGAWKLQLARELKAAGLDVDLNRVV